MKKSLLALALFAFAGTTAFGSDGHDKDGKKTKKECAKGMAGGSSCCMKKDTKTAAVKPEVKSPATVKLQVPAASAAANDSKSRFGNEAAFYVLE